MSWLRVNCNYTNGEMAGLPAIQDTYTMKNIVIKNKTGEEKKPLQDRRLASARSGGPRSVRTFGCLRLYSLNPRCSAHPISSNLNKNFTRFSYEETVTNNYRNYSLPIVQALTCKNGDARCLRVRRSWP